MALFCILLNLSACGGSRPAPSPLAAPRVTAVTIGPREIGIQHATEFRFDAVGSWDSSTMFNWSFGDGSSVSAGSSATHVYALAGVFNVTVEARNAAGASSVARTVEIKSLVGRWLGTVTGHQGRWPRPITAFALQINIAPTRTLSPSQGPGSWIDDAGCVWPHAIASVSSPAEVFVSIESLNCNDGDFPLRGTADAAVNVISGTCGPVGGSCTFRMVRQ